MIASRIEHFCTKENLFSLDESRAAPYQDVLAYLDSRRAMIGATAGRNSPGNGKPELFVPSYTDPAAFVHDLVQELSASRNSYSPGDLAIMQAHLKNAYWEAKPAISDKTEQRKLLTSYQRALGKIQHRKKPSHYQKDVFDYLEGRQCLIGAAAEKESVPAYAPSQFIDTLLQDLATNGQSYSADELAHVRQNLRKAYQEAKKSVTGAERWELLTSYRKALGKASYLEEQRKAVENKDYTSLLADQEKTLYQKLRLVHTWLSAQDKAKLYSKEGLFTLNSLKNTLETLVNRLAFCRPLDNGELKAYHRLQEKCTELQSAQEAQGLALKDYPVRIEVVTPKKPFPTVRKLPQIITFERKEKPRKERLPEIAAALFL